MSLLHKGVGSLAAGMGNVCVPWTLQRLSVSSFNTASEFGGSYDGAGRSTAGSSSGNHRPLKVPMLRPSCTTMLYPVTSHLLHGACDAYTAISALYLLEMQMTEGSSLMAFTDICVCNNVFGINLGCPIPLVLLMKNLNGKGKHETFPFNRVTIEISGVYFNVFQSGQVNITGGAHLRKVAAVWTFLYMCFIMPVVFRSKALRVSSVIARVPSGSAKGDLMWAMMQSGDVSAARRMSLGPPRELFDATDLGCDTFSKEEFVKAWAQRLRIGTLRLHYKLHVNGDNVSIRHADSDRSCNGIHATLAMFGVVRNAQTSIALPAVSREPVWTVGEYAALLSRCPRFVSTFGTDSKDGLEIGSLTDDNLTMIVANLGSNPAVFCKPFNRWRKSDQQQMCRLNAHTALLFCALRKLRWMPIATQVPVGISNGATLIDLIVVDGAGAVGILEVKCGYKGFEGTASSGGLSDYWCAQTQLMLSCEYAKACGISYNFAYVARVNLAKGVVLYPLRETECKTLLSAQMRTCRQRTRRKGKQKAAHPAVSVSAPAISDTPCGRPTTTKRKRQHHK